MAAAWPLTNLRLRTDRVELRLPHDDELAELALSMAHEPYAFDMPLNGRDDTPAERTQRFLRFHWKTLGTWEPGDWVLDLVAFVDGRPVGYQVVRGKDFTLVREVTTGSWLQPAHRGRGLGVHMRAAVLELAFTGLGARYAGSRARADNAASLAVSRKFGYVDDGIEHRGADGQAHRLLRVRLSAERWRAQRPDIHVDIEGVESCLPQFGLA